MSVWKIACVQMDCQIADKDSNLRQVRNRLQEAAGQGAQLVIFPECILTGYCFESKEEAWPLAETLPGPSTAILAQDCRQLKVWTVVGLLESRPDDGAMFNVCALIGPHGLAAVYRKIHLPYLGLDRFSTPGDRPFAVHDLGDLRLGMTICYDGSFPESARVLTLLGADLVVLPTNWPAGASRTAEIVVPTRALENHIYYAACNRIGEERGFGFIGRSQIVACDGSHLAQSPHAEPAILYAQIDPQRARQKRIVNSPGKYEVDRLADRRPQMYGPLCG